MNPENKQPLEARIQNYFEALITPPETRGETPSGDELVSEIFRAIGPDIPDPKDFIITLFSRCVQHFKDRANIWVTLIDTASWQLRTEDALKASSAGADTPIVDGVSSASGDTIIWPANIIAPLMLGLLSSATIDERISFYESLKSWNAFESLVRDVLPGLTLGQQESIALLTQIAKKFGKDVMVGMITIPLKQWIANNHLLARSLVDGWLANEPPMVCLDYFSVQLLVEGVTSRSEEEIEWRDRVIQYLIMKSEKSCWQLATYLAYSAWPNQTPIELRLGALISSARRLPEELVDIALWSLSHNARNHPVEILNACIQLLDLIPENARSLDRTIHGARLLANVLSAALSADKNLVLIEDALRHKLMKILLELPPGVATSELNMVLDRLLPFNAVEVEEFVRNWLEKHWHALINEETSFEDAFPLLSHRISHDKKITWILKFMCSPSAVLRAVSVIMFERNRNHGIPHEALKDLSVTQVSAAVHELAGGPLSAKALVPSLLRIGFLRMDVLDLVTDIISQEVVNLFPGTTDKSLGIWKKVLDDDQTATEIRSLLEVAYERVLAALEERKAVWQRKQAVPELLSTCLCYRETQELQRRQFAEQMRQFRRSGKMVWTQIASEIRIIYGNESIAGPGDQKISLQAHQSESIEMPLIPEIDPLGAALTRKQHRDIASSILTHKE